MPTGYTYAIEQGCSFEEYVWGCAKAFGACIMMRDDPADKPVPEKFDASKYHIERIEAAKAEQAQLDEMTAKEIDAAMQAERKAAEETNARNRRESEEKNRRYAEVRAQVAAWVPPTQEHAGLKKFMLEQIDLCYPDEAYQCELPSTAPADWLAAKRQRVARDLAYHTEENAKEIERTRGRNEWIQTLRQSVPQPVIGTKG